MIHFPGKTPVIKLQIKAGSRACYAMEILDADNPLSRFSVYITGQHIHNERIMKYLLLIACLLISVLEANACAIVIGYKNGRVLVGNNEDWYESDAKYWFEFPKKEDERYASYFFGFEGDGKFAQGGMNEAGLMFDGTFVPRIEIDRDRVKADGLKAAPVHLFKHILKRCKSIEEAEEVVDQYFIPYIRAAQVILVDANGGFLVIKANGVKEKGHLKEGEFKIITNFHLEDLPSGNYTCYRYDLAYKMLDDRFDNTYNEFEEVLQGVHQEYPGATVYSNIYDLKNASSELYYNARFDRRITIDFKGDLTEDPVFLEQGVFPKRMIETLISIYEKKGLNEVQAVFLEEKASESPAYQVDVQQLLDFSEYLFRKKKLSDYQLILEFAAKTYPENARAYLALGKFHLRSGEIAPALEDLKTCLDLDPDNYWANRLLEAYTNEKECNYEFFLKGFEDASSVLLFGNFNEWRGYDNVCIWRDDAWRTCISSSLDSFEYRFQVDGKWVEDPRNPASRKAGNGLKVSVVERQ